MQTYELLLKANPPLDDLDAAREWFASIMPTPFPGMSHQVLEPEIWRKKFGVDWQRNMSALRVMAKALQSKRPATVDPELLDAERVMFQFLDMLAVRPERSDSCKRQQHFRRYGQIGYHPTTIDPNGKRTDAADGLFFMRPEVFWQHAFGSLILDMPRRCSRCATVLGRTPKGKDSRASICRKCAFKEWKSKKKNRERLKVLWKKNKQEQRDFERKQQERQS